MIIKKDILGNTPKVGDTIAFNPTGYKGLETGVVTGFTKSGSPEVKPERVYRNGTDSDYGKLNKNGMYTPKTGFVIAKTMGKVRNGSIVKVIKIDKGNSSCVNKVGDIGTVRGYCSDLGSEGGFRVQVESRGRFSNWQDITEVEILQY